LGDSFNDTIDDILPSITHVTFGIDFNQMLDEMPSVKEIKMNRRYDKHINGNLMARIVRI